MPISLLSQQINVDFWVPRLKKNISIVSDSRFWGEEKQFYAYMQHFKIQHKPSKQLCINLFYNGEKKNTFLILKNVKKIPNSWLKINFIYPHREILL